MIEMKEKKKGSCINKKKMYKRNSPYHSEKILQKINSYMKYGLKKVEPPTKTKNLRD